MADITVSTEKEANCSSGLSVDNTTTDVRKEPSPDAASHTLPPPSRPSDPAQVGDYFSQNHDSARDRPTHYHMFAEPDPFDVSFSGQTTNGGEVATPGGTKLPPVASLTSPAPMLNSSGPYGWPNSLRSGPLSPAMLAGPATDDYFGDGHSYRGFTGSGVTPNESSMRTGLTPGGGGSMFPTVPSPNTTALFNLANGGATPGMVDFHRTALSAAALSKQSSAQSQGQSITSQPQNPNRGSNGNAERTLHQQPDPFSHGDANDAANGLFMLAQNSGRDGPCNGNSYMTAQPMPVRSQQGALKPGNSPEMRTRGDMGSTSSETARLGSIGSNGHSDEGEKQREKATTRGRGRRSNAQSNGRRRAEETPTKAPPSKKPKANNGNLASHMDPEPQSEEDPEQDMAKEEYHASGKKMTEEEKRKNFLERNRVAALKCRQRKKQWLNNLQQKCEMFSSENDTLRAQVAGMTEEMQHLRNLLLGHKECPSFTQQGIQIETYLASLSSGGYPNHPNMYSMGPAVQQQQQQQNPPFMNAEPMDRRFS